jgi:hypothetical protein
MAQSKTTPRLTRWRARREHEMEFVEQGIVSFRTTTENITPASHGHSIRLKRPDINHPSYQDPYNLYLIYITLVNNKLDVRQMYAENIGNVDQAEVDLYDKAKGTITGTNPTARNFHDLLWRHPCYVTIVLDIDGWDFYWGSVIGDDPLIFQPFKSDGSGPYDPNYSFYNANKNTIRGRPRVRCTNYLKGQDNGPVFDDPSDIAVYSIDVNLLTPFIDPNDKPIKIIIDPDGQNQGPP